MEELAPSYKTWIVETLLLGCEVGEIQDMLVQSSGISAERAAQEIATAQQHPYVAAATRYLVKLQKREGVLKTLDFYQRQDPDYLRLERRPLPPYADFLRDYLYQSRPALFTGAFDHWPARHWTPQSILEKVGAQTPVQVQIGRDSDSRYEENSHNLRKEMPFGAFIDFMETTVSNDIYMTANNLTIDSPAFAFLNADVGNAGDGYLAKEQTGSTLFLWMGPAGTVTPLHHDLTHNLFFQIYGRKRFRLYPATQAPYMYNETVVYSPVDPLNPDYEKFPLFAHAAAVDVTLEAGDMLYIPMAWWHHVVGETPSISLTTTRLHQVPNQFIGYPTDEGKFAY